MSTGSWTSIFNKELAGLGKTFTGLPVFVSSDIPVVIQFLIP